MATSEPMDQGPEPSATEPSGAIDGPVPSRRAALKASCAERDHPGATYNPWMDKTWCLCGAVVHDGNAHTHEVCCGLEADHESPR